MNTTKDPGSGPTAAQLALWLAKHTKSAYQIAAAVGEEAFELIVALLVLIMVERAYGQQGLGVYAYLTACLYAARYMTNYGVSRYVEHQVAVVADAARQRELITHGVQAIAITALAGAILLLATAGFDSSHTRIQERVAAYVIIALNLPLANLNHLKLSILHGRGDHGGAVRLRMLRYGLILAGIFLFTRIGVLPSYLLLVYLLADILTGLSARRHLKLPPLHAALRQPASVLQTLKQGQAYLFTDNALDLMLNIDLFVLGLFVTAWDLGVYAEAAVLVRFFLIVPAGIKPILRRFYSVTAAHNHTLRLSGLMGRNSAILFSLHAGLALLIALHFSTVLDLFFDTRLAAGRSFHIFTIFVPGLIFYGPFSAQEPVYEALGQEEDLKRLTLTVAAVNFCLTIYLVPAAGLFGAAAATMVTMVVYTGLFGRRLAVARHLDKTTFLISGLGVYLIYMLFKWLAWSPVLTIWMGPLIMGVLFYACGLFGVQPQSDAAGEVVSDIP